MDTGTFVSEESTIAKTRLPYPPEFRRQLADRGNNLYRLYPKAIRHQVALNLRPYPSILEDAEATDNRSELRCG